MATTISTTTATTMVTTTMATTTGTTTTTTTVTTTTTTMATTTMSTNTTTEMLVETTTERIEEFEEERVSFEDRKESLTDERREDAESLVPPITRGALRETSKIARRDQIETEKVECGCKTFFALERVAIELILILSVVLNAYLMFAYPILICMGRGWLKKQLRENRFEEKREKEREMFAEIKMDLGLNDRQERQERASAKALWLKCFRK